MWILMAEITTTFNGLCSDLHVSARERTAMVWHLAQFRLRKTVEKLLSTPAVGQRWTECDDCGKVVDDLLEHCEREDNICLIHVPVEKGQ